MFAQVDYSKHIFLGQVFSSNRAYFLSFDREQRIFEKKLDFFNLNKKSSIHRGMYIKSISPCSKNSYFYSKELKAQDLNYIVGAFFSTILDDCVDEAVGKYMLVKNLNKNFNAIAFSPSLDVKSLSFSHQGKPRPLTKKESASILKLKKEDESHAVEYECTTEIQYLDGAKILLEFTHKDKEIRISHYFNPGCAGHLNNIYILDIIKSGKLLYSYQTYHYEGAI